MGQENGDGRHYRMLGESNCVVKEMKVEEFNKDTGPTELDCGSIVCGSKPERRHNSSVVVRFALKETKRAYNQTDKNFD